MLAVVAAPLVVIALLAASWGVDTAISGDRVARNVELAGRPVGGMTREELADTVDALAEELPANPVTIDTGEFTIDTTAGELGLAIDPEATADQVWELGRDDPLPTRPVRWLQSMFTPRDAPVSLDVDAETLTASLATLEGDRRTAPTEPGLTSDEAGVQLVAGTDGRQLDTNAVVRALPTSLDELGPPIRINVERTVLEPSMTDESVQALADQANTVTGGTVQVSAGSQSFEIPGTSFRPAFAVAVDGSPEAPTPRLTMKPDVVATLLEENRPAGAGNPTGVRFELQGGTPVPVGGSDVQVCCGDGASDAIVQALLAGQTDVEVPTRTLTAAEGVEWARQLGINQVVGEFTTNHPAGQPRVQNIHRIADTLRGVVIAPGDTFSVNGFVGERTAAKGYVSAPIIENGEFTEGIGGGVSQFATTLFNAAFFAGLDIPAYMAHTKYISRYPFGREATLAYPSVDLKIRNNTPYGVMIWPTYTDSSISVQLWSTPYVRGEQTGQNKSSGCGEVVTTRTRTWVDGRTDTDRFRANYDCEE